MKNVSSYQVFKSLLLVFVITGFQSCSKDAEMDLMPDSAKLNQTELRTILEADSYTGLMDEVVMDLIEKTVPGRAKIADEDCYQINYTEYGFRAEFGNCILNTTENVNGVLEVTFSESGGNTSVSVNYTGFFVGGVQLSGTRIIDITQSGETNIDLAVQSDMTVALPEGTILKEKGSKALQIKLGNTLGNTTYGLTGNWTVSDGFATYAVDIREPLAGNLGCPYAVMGLMDIEKNGREISVDFGDGACDNEVTLIFPNGSREILEL
jgi:hypothetical protein